MKEEDKKSLGIVCLATSLIMFISLLIYIALHPVESIKNNYYEISEEEFYSDDFEVNNYFEEETEFCDDLFYIVTVTKYNPTVDQCDSDPLITADGSFIDLEKLNNGELKWIAISRDLRSEFNYGDTVFLTGGIEGEFIVRDTMNPKWTSRVDILSPIGDSKGKWEDVCMFKKK